MTKVNNFNCKKKSFCDKKKSNCDKNSKSLFVTTIKSSNCDQTWNLKKRQSSKTQIVTKLKNWNCDKIKKNWNCDKTQIATELKTSNINQTEETKIVIKLKKLKLDQTLKLNFDKGSTSCFGNNDLTPQQPMRCTLDSLCDLAMC